MEEWDPHIHPGKILLKEFLQPRGMSGYLLGKTIDEKVPGVYRILRGKQRITPRMALKLSELFDTDPRWWLKLQSDYDLQLAMEELQKERHETNGEPEDSSRTSRDVRSSRLER